MSDLEATPVAAGSAINIWKSLKGLPRDVWVLALASLVNRAGTMVLPFLVLYLTRELGFSAPGAGVVLGVYGVGSIIVAPIAGRLTDRVGPLPIMRISLLGTGLLLLVYPFVSSYWAILALTLAWALVSEGFRPANLSMVADVVPPEQLKSAYALIRLAINVGMSVGPAAAGFIASVSFSWIFVVDAVTTLAAAAVLIAMPFTSGKGVGPHPHTESGSGPAFRPIVFDDRRMLLFLSSLFLVALVFFQHEGALPLFLVEDLHLSPAFYGMLFTINTLLIVFIEVPLNAATMHWTHSRGLALGATFFALGSGALAFARGPVAVIAAIVIWTFGEMLLFPQASAYVAEIAPPQRRGQYMGAYSLAFSFAFAVAPWAGTSGFAHFGSRILWLGVFAVGALSAGLMLLVTTERSTEAAKTRKFFPADSVDPSST